MESTDIDGLKYILYLKFLALRFAYWNSSSWLKIIVCL